MRGRSILVLATVASVAVGRHVQRPDTLASAAIPSARLDAGQLRAEVAVLRATETTLIPPADSFTYGDRQVSSGSRVGSSIGVASGSLDVSGRIDGSVVVIGGDIRVHPGGEITGDAIAVGGRVSLVGGAVDGEEQSLSDIAPTTVVVAGKSPTTTWRALKLVLAWFGVLLIIGVGVLIFAEGRLDGVAVVLERRLGRAFFVGLLGQLLALPALLVLVVVLAITLVGILLIPFAIVAYTFVIAGLVTLGFLAVAQLSGTVVARDALSISRRGEQLRAMVFGVTAYMALWLLVAAFTWNPVIGLILRCVALVVTWAAATVGLGATLISRAGSIRSPSGAAPTGTEVNEFAWQTPTPVAGVAAARRPIAPTGSGR